MKISVVGLGKLGSPLAAIMADKGHAVIGVDLNRQFVEAIQAGRAPVIEPQLPEMIARNRERLSATLDYAEAIAKSELTFIVVPTPSLPDGTFSLKFALSSCEQIGSALAKKDGFHLVVMTSTVMPGSTGGPIQQALERASGKRCGVDFGLCYNPEFIALGSVVRDMLNPDVDVVTQAVGADSRIGTKYLKGALGYGGPCFPRDNVAFSALAQKQGVQALLAQATDRFNREQVAWLAEAWLKRLPAGGTVGILGLSYKPHTPVVEESQGVAFARYFLDRGAKVAVFDPAAMESGRAALGERAIYAASMEEVVRQSDLIVIATPWPAFRELPAAALKQAPRPTIIDAWRVLPPGAYVNAADVIVLGVG
ncbi:MAG: NAD(P)-binding domain-containing protein [Vicinamibacteria bacterium]|nr:NAD(P)-binding domain-containing protein [Vicinamibacteria bacterium]